MTRGPGGAGQLCRLLAPKRRERLAKLGGGVAVICVGATLEAEAKKLEAFEDAINAAVNHSARRATPIDSEQEWAWVRL